MTNWIYNGNVITELPSAWHRYYGFVYIITTNQGKKYVGKKILFNKRKKKFGKKRIAAMEDKRAKKWEYVIKESDWLTYTGSSKYLNEDIKKGVGYTKEILILAESKTHLTYLETKYMFMLGVLESDEYYNENILGRFYKIK